MTERPFENRAMRRARESQESRASRPRIDDLRERVEEDMTTITLYPTKGFRRCSGRRAEASSAMPMFAMMWAARAAEVRL